MRLNRLPHDIWGLVVATTVHPVITVVHLIIPLFWYYLVQIWKDLTENEEEEE